MRAALPVLGAGALAFGAVACGDDDDSGGGDGGGADREAVTIYSSLPLQGASRPQTTAMVEGIRLAVQQHDGRAGGYRIRYESLDDSTAQAGTWTPEATSSNARQAAQDDNAVAWPQGGLRAAQKPAGGAGTIGARAVDLLPHPCPPARGPAREAALPMIPSVAGKGSGWGP